MRSWGVSLAVGLALPLMGLAVWDIGRGARDRRPAALPPASSSRTPDSGNAARAAETNGAQPQPIDELTEYDEAAAPPALLADPSSTNAATAGEPADEDAHDKAPAARELVAPLLRAIRGEYPNAEARREAMLTGLRNSGPTSEAWAAAGRGVFQSWSESVAKSTPVSVRQESVACYRAGCELTVTFDSPEAAERAATAFRAIQEPGAQHGGRVQTPAVEENGTLTASWILLRPEG